MSNSRSKNNTEGKQPIDFLTRPAVSAPALISPVSSLVRLAAFAGANMGANKVLKIGLNHSKLHALVVPALWPTLTTGWICSSLAGWSAWKQGANMNAYWIQVAMLLVWPQVFFVLGSSYVAAVLAASHVICVGLAMRSFGKTDEGVFSNTPALLLIPQLCWALGTLIISLASCALNNGLLSVAHATGFEWWAMRLIGQRVWEAMKNHLI